MEAHMDTASHATRVPLFVLRSAYRSKPFSSMFSTVGGENRLGAFDTIVAITVGVVFILKGKLTCIDDVVLGVVGTTTSPRTMENSTKSSQ